MKGSSNDIVPDSRLVPRTLRALLTSPAVAALLLATCDAATNYPVVRPLDFAPLTSIPWDAHEGPEYQVAMPKVLEGIFGEPNLGIRYRLLEEYLRQIPTAEMQRAFDLCLPLEGTDTPEDLVAFFISVWVERDPRACWTWMKKLFRVAGLDGSALSFDSWTHEIRVHDVEGIRASPFWIERIALMGFPVAIDHSKLPRKERVRIMRDFADRWFSNFDEWPGFSPANSGNKGYPTRRHPEENQSLLDAFRQEAKPDALQNGGSDQPVSNLRFEVLLRRLLLADPAAAPELARKARERSPPKEETAGGESGAGPSDEFLLLWAQTDLPGMVRWVDSLAAPVDWAEGLTEPRRDLALRAKGLLLSLVDDEARERWLSAAKEAPKDEKEGLASLFQAWAPWDLEAAILAAARAGDPEAAYGLANAAVYAGTGTDWRGSRHAFQVLNTFDFSKLPPDIDKKVLDDAYSFMEQWDSMDVAAAARFGFAYLLRTNYAPREGLFRFFSGENIYGGEDGMIDRTFCALRIWAVVRPTEMKQWIGTLQDAGLRKALTWLLEHPLGKAKDNGRSQ
jgi:hypothetical protein